MEGTPRPFPQVPVAWAAQQLGDAPKNPVFPVEAVLQVLKTTNIPILHIGGDHDIVFPVENWHALNQQLPTLTQLSMPDTGHGPHMQYPSPLPDISEHSSLSS